MAIKRKNRGFTLLIAAIFMTVMLTFGLALASLAYKQQLLASTTVQSQNAFYSADAALECALYADQQLGSFVYQASGPGPTISCDGTNVTFTVVSRNAQRWKLSAKFPLDSGTHCATLTVYKPSSTPTDPNTYLFSQGYDVACSVIDNPGSARYSTRGIQAYYSSGG